MAGAAPFLMREVVAVTQCCFLPRIPTGLIWYFGDERHEESLTFCICFQAKCQGAFCNTANNFSFPVKHNSKMSQGSHQKATRDTDLYPNTGNENVPPPPLLYFHYWDSLQTGPGHNCNWNSLLCPFSCPLNWACVFAKQRSDLITYHSLQKKKKRWDGATVGIWLNPWLWEMTDSTRRPIIRNSRGEASEEAFGWNPQQEV